MHPLLQKIKALQLAAGDFAIFGSGPLLVRGIIQDVSDIDVICRGSAWQQAQDLGELCHLDNYDVEVVAIDNGRITFGCSWGIGNFDIDELIDSAESIGGLPFVKLEYVIDYKRMAARPKDRAHLELTRIWIASKKMADLGE